MNSESIAIGFYGTEKDDHENPWRPTLALCTAPEFPIDRLVLLHYERYRKEAEGLKKAIEEASPHKTKVALRRFEIPQGESPWDFAIVYRKLRDFAAKFNAGNARVFVHTTVGTEAARNALTLLVKRGDLPGSIVRVAKPGGDADAKPTITVVELSAREVKDAEDDGALGLLGAIVSRSDKFRGILREIRKAAICSPDPILLLGETGVGKTKLAERIFEMRRDDGRFKVKAFVALNCATLEGPLLQSHLFGHKEGAFTGANKDRSGILKTADGGMVFLDEVGTLALDTQAMLLKAIEEGTFRPVGGDEDTQSRFQLVAATNEDIHAKARRGEFRPDLLARLGHWCWRLPPLRERPEDIERWTTLILDEWNTGSSRADGQAVSFSRAARSRFLAFARPAHWSGNLRDLRQTIRRMAALAETGVIGIDEVESEKPRLQAQWASTGGAEPDVGRELLERLLGARAATLSAPKRASLVEVLRACARSRSRAEAGRVLGLAQANSTAALNKLLRTHGLTFEAVQRALTELG